jgi:peptide/nickel transport system substrate-binding protein
VASGCGKNASQNKAGQKAAADSGAVDYEAIQKRALSFVPQIGAYGGQIVLSSITDPKSFNPITSTETSTTEFVQYLYEGLVRINGVTLLPEPNIADSWTISPDGLVWTFHMRPGVLWSDSVPVSAYDVSFTFNDLIYNENIKPCSSRDILTIQGRKIKVEVVDSSQVRFTLPCPYAPFLRFMSEGILPRHKYGKFVKNNTFSTALSIKTPPSEMVGNGPYLLESYLSAQKVIFRRNPLYWRRDSAGNALPYLERVVYMIVQNQNADVLSFKKGEVDFLVAKGEDYPSLKSDADRFNYTVYRLGPATGSYFIFFNQNTGADPKSGRQYVDSVKLSWFRNVNFRKAVACALDKENMIRIVMNGLGYPQWSPMTPSEGYFFNPDVEKYPYDIEKARRLLAAEGFRDTNGDSVLEDKNGHPVEFSLITNSENNVRGKIAEIIRKDLTVLGMKVHFQLIEFNSLVQKLDNPPYAWDAILLGLTGGDEPHFGKNVWHSSGTLHMWFPRQKKPSTDWEAAIDSLFDAGVRELDIQKRKAVYDQWQRIVADKLPLIYTVLPERIFCIADKFGNLNPSTNGGLLHNMEYFYLKKQP